MSRYEDAVRMAQVKQLVGERKYNKAAGLLRTINPKQIRSVADLKASAKAFSEVGQYTTAKELYLRLYKKEKEKSYLQQLVYICIKAGEYDEAEKYYQQFVSVSRSKRDDLILHYRIRKAAGADVNELISILEELKSEEYLEEWAYELARMYQKAGRNEDCRKECENIRTWFGSGEVVERATVLLAYLTVDANLSVFPDKDYTIHEEPKNPEDTMTIPPLDPEILKNQKKAEKERRRKRKEDREAFLIADAEQGFYEEERKAAEAELGADSGSQDQTETETEEISESTEAGNTEDSEIPEFAKVSAEGNPEEPEDLSPVNDEADAGSDSSDDAAAGSEIKEITPDEDKDTGKGSEAHSKDSIGKEEDRAEDKESSAETRKKEESVKEGGNIADIGRQSADSEYTDGNNGSHDKEKDDGTSAKGKEREQESDSGIIAEDPADSTVSHESFDGSDGNNIQFKNFPIEEQEKFIRDSQSGTGITKDLAAEISTIMQMEKEGKLDIYSEDSISFKGGSRADAPEGMKEILDDAGVRESGGKPDESKNKSLNETDLEEKTMSDADKIMPEPDMPEKKQVEPRKKRGFFSAFRKNSNTDAKTEEVNDDVNIVEKKNDDIIEELEKESSRGNSDTGLPTTRAIRKSIQDVLTLINGEPEPTNYVLIGSGNEKILGVSKKIVRIMNRKKFISSTRIALISAEQLNDLDISSVREQLKGGCLLVADASQLLFSTINKVTDLMDEYSGDFCVILSDEGDTLDGLFKLYPPLAERFQYVIDVSSYGPEDYN